jgi:PqqD family protein of HPr-rel-A system
LLDVICGDVTALVERVPGLCVESVGSGWAAFSPVSGETLLLNDEAAAVLEVLSDGPATRGTVCAALASDSGTPAAEIEERLAESWEQFVRAGLVRLSEDTARAS